MGFLPSVVAQIRSKFGEGVKITDNTNYDAEANYRVYRLRIDLGNNYTMSVVSGSGAYAAQAENTFEVAIISPTGDIVTGDVQGWQTLDQVVELFQKYRAEYSQES
jgi:hypothetical protein